MKIFRKRWGPIQSNLKIKIKIKWETPKRITKYLWYIFFDFNVISYNNSSFIIITNSSDHPPTCLFLLFFYFLNTIFTNFLWVCFVSILLHKKCFCFLLLLNFWASTHSSVWLCVVMDACGVASSSSSSSNPKPPHVLAVDDSIVDRKIVENLLKNSACKGTLITLDTKRVNFFPPIFWQSQIV